MTGLLWQDTRPDELKVKVRRAAERYHQKLGGWPNVCYINEADMDGTIYVRLDPKPNGAGDNGVWVIPLETVQPNHFWLGERSG